MEQLREESSDELNRRKEDYVQVQSEGRISRHPEQACEEDYKKDHLPGLDPSVNLAGDKECQTRRRGLLKHVGRSEQLGRQEQKRQRRLKRAAMKGKKKLGKNNELEGKQDRLRISQDQEEPVNDEMRRQSQEEFPDLEESPPGDDVPHGEFADGACRTVDYLTNLAQEDDPRNDNSTPTIRGENRIHSGAVNKRRAGDNEMAQDYVGMVQTLDNQARTKRGRERGEDVEVSEDIRARQAERGQLFVNEGKFQRLNYFPRLHDDTGSRRT